MDEAASYRRAKATECLQLANNYPDIDTAKWIMKLASSYLAVAEKLEANANQVESVSVGSSI